MPVEAPIFVEGEAQRIDRSGVSVLAAETHTVMLVVVRTAGPPSGFRQYT